MLVEYTKRYMISCLSLVHDGAETDMFSGAGWSELETGRPGIQPSHWDWVRYQVMGRHNTDCRGFG